jgi:glycosyltransferase involved in cell wall biosynthesis
MSVPKFSIITVNYNNKLGLQKTVDSVFSQDNQNFEFIIIDGNSTDGSKDIIEEHAAKFTYWCSEPDQGIYNGMNKGIRQSSGKYLLFLNSGDWLHNNKVMERMDALINDDHQIYYGDIVYHEAGEFKTVTFPDKLTFSFFYKQNISHQAAFIERSLFYTFFFYNEEFKIVSDWEFLTYAICKHNVSYQHLDVIVTDYDGSGISSMVESHHIQRLEREQSLQKYFPAFVEDYEFVPELKQKKVQLFFHIKRHSIAWKFLKAYMKLISIFISKLSPEG